MIIIWIIAVLVLLHIIGFIIAKAHANETSSIAPYGQMVRTSHGSMHLYEMGSKDNDTIVILPGLGNALPCADFAPLMRDLSDTYHVVCIDYLSTGFSDYTALPRISSQYVAEIREALENFGCKPPYILMPHSCSGIYCEYYAAKYPQEIRAMIELDCTSSASDKLLTVPNWFYKLSHFQQTCGVNRFFSLITPPIQKLEYGYTKKEQHDYKLFSLHNMTPALADQNLQLFNCVQEVKGLPYPSTIPTLKIESEQAIKRFGEQYQKDHIARLGANTVEATIPGSVHMMHEKNHKDIADLSKKFLK